HGAETNLLDHVQTVVARRSIAPKGYGNAAIAHLRNRCQPGSEFQVRARAVQNLDVMLCQQRLLSIRHPHAMRHAETGWRETGVGEILEVRESTGQASNFVNFIPRLRR